MHKRLALVIIVAILILVVAVVLFTLYYDRPTTDSNTNTPVTYTVVTDNELVILHLNANVLASKVGVRLQLTSHSQTEDGVDTAVTVQDSAGTELGEIRFSRIDETQTVGNYRFRLVSATKSAVQVLALATVSE